MMEAAFRRNADSLPHIPYAVTVMVMALTIHTEDSDGVGNALNIFLFPDLSLLA